MLGIMLQSDGIGLLFINFQFQWTNNIKPTHTVGNHNQIQSTADNAPLSHSDAAAPSSHIILPLPLNLNYVPPERDTSNTWKWIYCIVIVVLCQCCLFGFKFKYFISSLECSLERVWGKQEPNSGIYLCLHIKSF